MKIGWDDPLLHPWPSMEGVEALIDDMIEEGVIYEDEDGGLYLTEKGRAELEGPGVD